MGRDRQGDSALVLESIHRLELGQEVATIIIFGEQCTCKPWSRARPTLFSVRGTVTKSPICTCMFSCKISLTLSFSAMYVVYICRLNIA